MLTNSLLDARSHRTVKVEAFYLKSIACWVPHILIPNHVPTCPHCEKKKYVDLKKSRWVNCPKLLYGLSTHRYLDTMLYHCRNCARHFTGYNRHSMELDGSVYYSYFNFYLGPRYAVDEELYRTIVLEASTEATAIIHKRLTARAYDCYFSDHQMCWKWCKLSRVCES